MITYTIFGKADRIEDVPDGATIETVDGNPVIALCEGCGKPIVDDDTGNQWDDGVWTCAECGGPQDDLELPNPWHLRPRSGPLHAIVRHNH